MCMQLMSNNPLSGDAPHEAVKTYGCLQLLSSETSASSGISIALPRSDINHAQPTLPTCDGHLWHSSRINLSEEHC